MCGNYVWLKAIKFWEETQKVITLMYPLEQWDLTRQPLEMHILPFPVLETDILQAKLKL